MKCVLGVTGLAHDAAIAVVQDGEIVVAVENERVTRRKGEWTFPTAALEVALRAGGLRHRDVDEIRYYWDDRGTLTDALLAEAKNAGKIGWRVLPRMAARISAAKSEREVVARLTALWDGPLPAVHFVNHHLAHVKYAFCTSGYEEAACLVVDGRGEFSTASIYDCSGDVLTLRWQQSMPASLGYVYGAVTQHLGFEPLADEYRVMGLAPYGEEDPVLDAWFRRLVSFVGGKLEVDPRLVRYHIDERTCQPWLSHSAHAALGAPRHGSAPLEERHANIARAVQNRFEAILLQLASYARDLTGRNKLVLAGGCAMNSVANGKLRRAAVFDDVFVPPAPGDQGCAIGAAFTAFEFATLRSRLARNSSALLGPAFSDSSILDVLLRNKISYEHDESLGQAAGLVAEGKIGGVFDGPMEFGPRALGGRSIIADARIAETRDRLNEVVKMREAFRPFAGAVFEDVAHQYFVDPAPSPYMNHVTHVLPEARRKIPAIVHVDGSCRIQTVKRGESRFASLVAQFEALTGLGVVVNTSFNVKGEPIVMTPEDALRCFYGTGLDFLQLGPYLLRKEPG